MSGISFLDVVNGSIILEFVEPTVVNGRLTDDEYQTASRRLRDLDSVPEDKIFFKNPDKEEVFLTDVGFQDHGRVYHIEGDDAKKFRRVRIPLDGLGKSQPTAQREGIQRAIDIAHDEDPDESKKVPQVVLEDGTYFVQDGHHRSSALLLAKRKDMVCDLIEKRGDKFYVPKKVKSWQEV